MRSESTIAFTCNIPTCEVKATARTCLPGKPGHQLWRNRLKTTAATQVPDTAMTTNLGSHLPVTCKMSQQVWVWCHQTAVVSPLIGTSNPRQELKRAL
ncbi:hypothetical protein BaRGS_00008682 [Batillaria attramentaria]|uniref:Uncharacterized protein n=1 Tax=Batillaria attramentaria TaxID=370345 RepID=A0ABD0LKW6_9CAEN